MIRSLLSEKVDDIEAQTPEPESLSLRVAHLFSSTAAPEINFPPEHHDSSGKEGLPRSHYCNYLLHATKVVAVISVFGFMYMVFYQSTYADREHDYFNVARDVFTRNTNALFEQLLPGQRYQKINQTTSDSRVETKAQQEERSSIPQPGEVIGRQSSMVDIIKKEREAAVPGTLPRANNSDGTVELIENKTNTANEEAQLVRNIEPAERKDAPTSAEGRNHKTPELDTGNNNASAHHGKDDEIENSRGRTNENEQQHNAELKHDNFFHISNTGPEFREFAARGKLAEVHTYIQRHPELLNSTDNNGWLAIHEAARGGRAEVVKMLCKAGADANVRSNFGSGEVPMYFALKKFGSDHPVVSALFKECGADMLWPIIDRPDAS